MLYRFGSKQIEGEVTATHRVVKRFPNIFRLVFKRGDDSIDFAANFILSYLKFLDLDQFPKDESSSESFFSPRF